MSQKPPIVTQLDIHSLARGHAGATPVGGSSRTTEKKRKADSSLRLLSATRSSSSEALRRGHDSDARDTSTFGLLFGSEHNTRRPVLGVHPPRVSASISAGGTGLLNSPAQKKETLLRYIKKYEGEAWFFNPVNIAALQHQCIDWVCNNRLFSVDCPAEKLNNMSLSVACAIFLGAHASGDLGTSDFFYEFAKKNFHVVAKDSVSAILASNTLAYYAVWVKNDSATGYYYNNQSQEMCQRIQILRSVSYLRVLIAKLMSPAPDRKVDPQAVFKLLHLCKDAHLQELREGESNKFGSPQMIQFYGLSSIVHCLISTLTKFGALQGLKDQDDALRETLADANKIDVNIIENPLNLPPAVTKVLRFGSIALKVQCLNQLKETDAALELAREFVAQIPHYGGFMELSAYTTMVIVVLIQHKQTVLLSQITEYIKRFHLPLFPAGFSSILSLVEKATQDHSEAQVFRQRGLSSLPSNAGATQGDVFGGPSVSVPPSPSYSSPPTAFVSTLDGERSAPLAIGATGNRPSFRGRAIPFPNRQQRPRAMSMPNVIDIDYSAATSAAHQRRRAVFKDTGAMAAAAAAVARTTGPNEEKRSFSGDLRSPGSESEAMESTSPYNLSGPQSPSSPTVLFSNFGVMGTRDGADARRHHSPPHQTTVSHQTVSNVLPTSLLRTARGSLPKDPPTANLLPRSASSESTCMSSIRTKAPGSARAYTGSTKNMTYFGRSAMPPNFRSSFELFSNPKEQQAEDSLHFPTFPSSGNTGNQEEEGMTLDNGSSRLKKTTKTRRKPRTKGRKKGPTRKKASSGISHRRQTKKTTKTCANTSPSFFPGELSNSAPVYTTTEQYLQVFPEGESSEPEAAYLGDLPLVANLVDPFIGDGDVAPTQPLWESTFATSGTEEDTTDLVSFLNHTMDNLEVSMGSLVGDTGDTDFIINPQAELPDIRANDGDMPIDFISLFEDMGHE